MKFKKMAINCINAAFKVPYYSIGYSVCQMCLVIKISSFCIYIVLAVECFAKCGNECCRFGVLERLF
jgi:hypothetical protein